jgi:adenylate cyclase
MVTIDAAREAAPAIERIHWDRVLTEGHTSLVKARRVFRYLPSAPRCRVCNNPLGVPAERRRALFSDAIITDLFPTGRARRTSL